MESLKNNRNDELNLNKAELSSTADPHDSSKKNAQNNQLKIYNIMYNNFSYEQDVLHKNLKDFDMDKSTPSLLSEQSLSNTSYFLNSVPVFKEMILYGECNLYNNFLSQSEFFKILKKLRITNNLEIALNLLEKFDLNKDSQISFKEFILFFCKDIRMLDFEAAFTPEIVFRFGVEIFRAIGKERTYLEIRDLMNFLKENEALDIDLVLILFVIFLKQIINSSNFKIQILEMFDFYDDIYSGTLKRKVNILGFFQNTGMKIAKAIDNKFLEYLKVTFKNFKQQERTTRKIIKVYEKNMSSTLTASSKDKKSILLEKNAKQMEFKKAIERNFSQIHNVNQIIIEDITNDNNNNSSNNLQKEIEDFFKENQPKNKGWLFRNNSENNNNWQNLFFCLVNDNTKLISLHLKSLKKIINIPNLEVHKCNFLETIQLHKANSSKNHDSNLSNRDNAKKSFFLVDLQTKKTYLVRSNESLAILSVINFYISKNKTTAMRSNTNSLIQIIETAEPHYSGIIEIACCKAKNIHNFHSDLKSYSFKPKFLELKANKLLIYEYSIKDSLNLMDYDLTSNNQQDQLPQRYSFFLEKKTSMNYLNELQEENEDSMKDSFVVFNTLHENQENNNKKQGSHPTEPNQFKGLEVIYENEENKNKEQKSRFAGFKNFISKFSRKKPEKLYLAADSEFKRKEWVFSLNYYKTLILKTMIKKKNDSAGLARNLAQSGFDSHQVKSPKNMNNFFKSSFQDKNHKNPDFYDVFSPNNNEEKTNNIQENLKKNPKTAFYTEPDHKNNVSEDLLLTFNNLNADTLLIPNCAKTIMDNKNIGNNNYMGSKYLMSQNNENNCGWINIPNKEIKTLKEEELWQKFLKYFLKMNHECTEMEINESPKQILNESSVYDYSESQSEEIFKTNPVFQSNYAILKKK